MQTHDLDFFQLDNLIRNRIPFCFFNFGTPLKSHYQLMEKIHLSTWLIDITSHDEIEKQIVERNLPLQSGVIIICHDGVTSRQSQEKLLQKGFSNVYIISGGYNQIRQDFPQA